MHRLTNTNVPKIGEWKKKQGNLRFSMGDRERRGRENGVEKRGVGVSNLLWILVSHLISGVVHRGATGVTPVLLTIVAAAHIWCLWHNEVVVCWGSNWGHANSFRRDRVSCKKTHLSSYVRFKGCLFIIFSTSRMEWLANRQTDIKVFLFHLKRFFSVLLDCA